MTKEINNYTREKYLDVYEQLNMLKLSCSKPKEKQVIDEAMYIIYSLIKNFPITYN